MQILAFAGGIAGVDMPLRMVYGREMTHRSSQRIALICQAAGLSTRVVAMRGALLLLVLVLITNGGVG
jgi:hypothetical protein